MQRFGKDTFTLQNLSPEVAIYHMVMTLKPNPFLNRLCKKPEINLDEL